MPSLVRQACQRKTFACAIASLVLLVGLLIFVVMYLSLSWQAIVQEGSSDDMSDDCRSRARVVTDEAIMQRWDVCSANFSRALSGAEQSVGEPAHKYMEKHHSFALYVYTNIMLQPANQNVRSAERTGKHGETPESRFLDSSLSEAIQILKHSQVTCLSTNYRTETPLHLNVSNKQVRFSTFMLGSDEWNLTRTASCFDIYSCFGADITHYSALKLKTQVLIPPYEVFKVTDIQTESKKCEVIYRLRSNLDCVYNKDSNTLQSISALPVEGFWLIFTITCIIIISLLLPFIVVKVCHNKAAVSSVSSLHNRTAVTLWPDSSPL